MCITPKEQKKQFSTASTFKILNSLIALEEGIVEDANTIIKWNGTQYDYPSWNQDHTLRSAVQVSCVWCYQQIAAQVGPDTYRDYVDRLGYGKLKETFNDLTFWLDNGLVISAFEQIQFLQNVYQQTLPFSEKSFATLSDIMLQESPEGSVLRAKTGWAARVSPQVGWYVGYIEIDSGVWFFATNLEITSPDELPLRESITLQALKLKNLLN